jgi:hypothetical protein
VGCDLRREDRSPADVTLTGSASDVLLMLGGRPSAAVLSGDRAAFDAWRTVLG